MRSLRRDAENFVRFCIMTGHDLAADKELSKPARLRSRVDALVFSLAGRIATADAIRAVDAWKAFAEHMMGCIHCTGGNYEECALGEPLQKAADALDRVIRTTKRGA